MRSVLITCFSFPLTLGEQFSESGLGERGADLEAFADDAGGDQLVGADFLVELVVGALVEQDHVVQLVAHLSLRPLLQRSSLVPNPTSSPLCSSHLFLGLSTSASSVLLLAGGRPALSSLRVALARSLSALSGGGLRWLNKEEYVYAS